MKIISCENFELQQAQFGTPSDTIIKCLNTGKQYQYINGQWNEYFSGLQAGGNIKVTPLSQGVPAASVQNVQAVDSPFCNDIVDNYCKINTSLSQSASYTYGWGFVQQHSTKITLAKVICTTAGGTAQFGLYNSAGTLIAKSAPITTSTGFLSLPISQDASGNAISGISLTGGNLYYFGIALSSASCALAGFSGMSSTSYTYNPLQMTASTSIPLTVTLNSGAKTVAAYVALISGV